MYFAVVDSASLNNPMILNNYRQIRVTVQDEPQSSATRYHHAFVLKFENEDIEKIISEFQAVMLPAWFSFFWDDIGAYIIFDKEKFYINLKVGWVGPEVARAIKFGRDEGIADEYLDFEKYFEPHQKTVAKLVNISNE